MIHPNTDLKFRITAELDGFSLTDDNFTVTVKNLFGQTIAQPKKEKMLRDTDGGFIFTIPSAPTGIYFAQFIAFREDDDFDTGIQQIVDRQHLVTVGMCDGNYDCPCSKNPALTVTYTLVWETSVEDGTYIVDSEGNPIVDSEGNKIYVITDPSRRKVYLNMTGDQFKTLVEGTIPNDEVDTIPEMKAALKGIKDKNYSVKEEIKNDTESTYVDEEESLYIDGEKPQTED